MLKRITLLACCIFVATQAHAQGTGNFQLFRIKETAAECVQGKTGSSAAQSTIVVLNTSNGQLAQCFANYDLGNNLFCAAPSCSPIQCKNCNLIPSGTTGQSLFVGFSPSISPETAGSPLPFGTPSAILWSINEQTGSLTVCGLSIPNALCQNLPLF